MKKLVTAVLAGFLFLAGGSAQAAGPTLLLDYVGFDFEDPDPDSTQFGEVGSGYQGVGDVPNLFAPLVADTANNYYTYHFSGLTSMNVTPVGDFIIVDYGPGVLSIYEDSKGAGTDGVFGAYPPNATVTSTFTDGTLILVGTLSGFQHVFNTVQGSGSFDSTFEATGGTQLGNIPVNERTGWTFAGTTSNDLNVPPGYEHQVDGQVFLDAPVPIENTTWGSIKSQYR